MAVSCPTATTPRRNVTIKKRTRPNHGSHSLTLGFDTIWQLFQSLGVRRTYLTCGGGHRRRRPQQMAAAKPATRFTRSRCYFAPESFPISENSGKYMEMTTPPTTIPRNTIMIGSRAVSRSFTAASTSSS